MKIRHITPADEAAYRSILERTSEQDRYYRFFRAVDILDPAEVHRFVESRPDMAGFIAEESDMLGFIAEKAGISGFMADQAGLAGASTPLGAAHAALLPDGSAELAIVVSEEARRRGVGKALLEALIIYLQTIGCRRIIAHSLQENIGFAHLAASVGLHIEHAEGSDVRWSLEAAPTPMLAD
jgi:GNAT superfamily N-acetyltransferase